MSGGEALSDIIDHIDGWSLKSVGQNYGNSYKLKYMDEWIYNICLQSNSWYRSLKLDLVYFNNLPEDSQGNLAVSELFIP